MTPELGTAIMNAAVQAPLVAVALFIANIYRKDYKSTVNTLMEVFKAEIKACELRYESVFTELMRTRSDCERLSVEVSSMKARFDK